MVSDAVAPVVERVASKYPLHPRWPLAEIRKALKAARGHDSQIEVLAFMEQGLLSAEDADRRMRELAGLGYVHWVPQTHRLAEPPFWELTALGRRLLVDDLAQPIPRAAAEAILQEALTRIRTWNADDPATVITEARLYGSLLDATRTEVGDVDLDLHIIRRPERATEGGGSFLEAFFKAPVTVKRALEKGQPKLSVSFGDAVTMGYAHRVLYRFDPDSRTERPGDEHVTPEDPQDAEARLPLPAVTAMAPKLPDLERNRPFRLKGNGVVFEDLAREEARAWAGQLRQDLLAPRDLSRTLPGRLMGARHLLDAWRDKDASGHDLLAAALAWAEGDEADWARHLPLRLRVTSGRREADHGPVRVRRVADRLEGRLATFFGTVSRGEIAVEHTIAVALGRLIDAMGPHHGTSTEIELDVPGFLAEGTDGHLALGRAMKAFGAMAKSGGEIRTTLTPDEGEESSVKLRGVSDDEGFARLDTWIEAHGRPAFARMPYLRTLKISAVVYAEE